jgi:L,D-transpeptidase ErfK/SrfK
MVLNLVLYIDYYFSNMKILMVTFTALIFLASLSSSAHAEAYSYDRDNSTVIGSAKIYTVNGNESLIEIARKFGLGYNEIVSANPDLDPFLPGDNARVVIPTAWVLPDAPSYQGIIINLSEMRLYYFFKQSERNLVRTFPVGIGDDETDTPIGSFKITEKSVRPSWNVPKSIRQRRPYLPSVVPPGPNNPLGSHALRLSWSSYLIHGTNRPWSIGRRFTSGCIRLYPEDIPKLFQMVPVGTNVLIVRQPVKVGARDGKVYIEVHKDDTLNINYFNEAVRLLKNRNLLGQINTERLYQAIREKKGMPVEISN